MNVTFAWPSAAAADTPRGTLGSPRGVTAFEVAEAGPTPPMLLAVTVKV